MKKTILLSSILAVGAAFADVTPIEVNSTEVGVIKLAKPTKATLIAVPFLGYEGGDIKVADMINTAELAVGTKLYVPNNSTGTLTYNVWTLSANGKWVEPKTIIDINNLGEAKDATGAAANESSVARGGSYWLEPPAEPPANSTDTTSFYLLGKPGAEAGTTRALAGKWNLVGNASTASLAALGGAVTKNDQVSILVNGKFREYIYKGVANGWCYTDSTGLHKNAPLPVNLGQGLWFRPTENSTINWSTGAITATAAQ